MVAADIDERCALIDAICARPDDDNPRHAYADWLDRHGEEGRAEFIRLQLTIANPPTCAVCKGRGSYLRRPTAVAHLCQRCGGHGVAWPALELSGLRVQEADFLRRDAPHWLFGFNQKPHGYADESTIPIVRFESFRSMIDCGFARGFVSRISLPWKTWLGTPHPIVHGARVPTIRSPIKQPITDVEIYGDGLRLVVVPATAYGSAPRVALNGIDNQNHSVPLEWAGGPRNDLIRMLLAQKWPHLQFTWEDCDG